MNNYKKTIRTMFKDIFENPTFDEAAIDGYFSTEYIQQVDGKIINFEQFKQHVRVLKDSMKSVSAEFKTLVQEDNIVFSNHLISGLNKEDRSVEGQVIAEFTFKDGKIISCDELTRMTKGDEKDRDLGSRH
ncbi:nuclear transport factor 2 family protein [Pedobacter sp. L105]|uniref:nuclear transport factor 2 family protein n=1 Tax=Pedobacter sp. L105 TaxID=1641871 RepID=UPI00131E5F47|nr:nuclear transport factor 2 family protein [Pedobacter sp. L105]